MPSRYRRGCARHSGYSCEHAPAGPVAAALSTGVAQPAPSHWFQIRSEAACTQVRGGTARPSVADWHQPNVLVHPAVDACHPHRVRAGPVGRELRIVEPGVVRDPDERELVAGGLDLGPVDRAVVIRHVDALGGRAGGADPGEVAELERARAVEIRSEARACLGITGGIASHRARGQKQYSEYESHVSSPSRTAAQVSKSRALGHARRMRSLDGVARGLLHGSRSSGRSMRTPRLATRVAVGVEAWRAEGTPPQPPRMRPAVPAETPVRRCARKCADRECRTKN